MQRLYHLCAERLKQKTLAVFVFTLAYYAALWFVSSNVAFFAVTLCYFLAVYVRCRSIGSAIMAVFVATIPVARSKSVEITILSRSAVHLSTKNSLTYYLGISIQDAVVTGLLYLYLRSRLKHRAAIHIDHALTVYFLFVFLNLATSFTSPSQTVSLYGVLLLLKAAIVYVAFRIPRDRDALSDPGFLPSVFATATIQIIWSFVQRGTGGKLGKFIEAQSSQYLYGKSAWENPDLYRVTGTFIDPDLFGTFLLIVMTIVFVAWLRKELPQWMEKTVPVFLFGGIAAIVFTANRGLYGLCAFVFAGTGFIFRKELMVRIRQTKRIVVLLGIGLCLFAIPYAAVRIYTSGGFFSETGSGTFRLQMLLSTAVLGLSHITGLGLLSSPYYFATAFAGQHLIFSTDFPHNLLSEIFSESGIAGLVLFLSFLYLGFRDHLNLAFRGKNSALVWGALVYLLSAQFYPLFLDNVELFLLFMLLLGAANIDAESI